MPIKEIANKKCIIRVTPSKTIQPVPPDVIWPEGKVPGLTATGTAYYDFAVDNVSHVEAKNAAIGGEKIVVDAIKNKLPGVPTPPAGGTAADFGCQVPGNLVTTWISRGSFEIRASATRANCDGKPVLRKDDSATASCSCSGKYTPSGSSPISCTGSCSIQIVNAGQARIKAQ